MKTLVILTFSLIFCSQSLLANDSEVYSSGCNLFPVKETKIELRKEILSLKLVHDNWMEVNVYFEFYNPLEARNIEMGFVTPFTHTDSIDGVVVLPYTKEFNVIANGKSLPFSVKKMIDSSDIDESRFAFYFNADFKPGINIVQHSYFFKGGANLDEDTYDYVITTGKNWANGKIGDFELNIDMGPGIHSIPYNFTNADTVDWKIIGTGKFMPMVLHKDSWDGELSLQKVGYLEIDDKPSKIGHRLVYMQNGYVTCRIKDFAPDNEIDINENFNIFGRNYPGSFFSELSRWCICKDAGLFTRRIMYAFKEYMNSSIPDSTSLPGWEEYWLSSFSKDELKLMHDLIYARKGLDFKDEATQKIFESFLWYMPNPSLKEEDIFFSDAEKNFLQRIDDYMIKK